MAVLFRYTYAWLVVLLLAACSSADAQPTPDTVPAETLPTSFPTVTPIAAQTTPTSALPENWTTVAWQNFVIPLPPQAQWQELFLEGGAEPAAPVLARGGISYRAKAEGVEQPYGPIFTLYTFSGSLDEWIELQQQRGSSFVDASTIQDTALASRPAKRYQPLVTGTCNAGFYIAKVDATQLVELATECIDTELYTTIINQLQFQTR